jgi:hypothetical protein
MAHKRITFYGREISINEMTQQHLTNAYYYSLIFSTDIFLANIYLEELNERFNGELLQYRPLASFPIEIRQLKKYGLAKDDDKIYYNGKCIGELPKGDKIIDDINEL